MELQKITFRLTKQRFPYLFQGKNIAINQIEVFAKTEEYDESTLKLSLAPGEAASREPLTLAPWNGLLRAQSAATGPPGDWTLAAWLDTGDGRLNPRAIQDIVVVCYYTILE
jgi:hypothetical protein